MVEIMSRTVRGPCM